MYARPAVAPTKRRLTAAGAVGGTALLLAACSADPGDFRDAAEKFIQTREFSEQTGSLRYHDVECEDPADTEIDTTYTCVAVAEDDSRWLFTVEITGDKALEVWRDPQRLSSGGDDTPATTSAETAPLTTSGDSPTPSR